MGSCDRISPEAPVPVILNPEEKVLEGGACNVFNNLLALGADVDIITDDMKFAVKKRIVADNHIICRIDEEHYYPYNVDLKKFDLSEVRYAILSDYNKGVLHYSESIIDILNAHGIKVLVDPKKKLERYNASWLVKMNKKEFEHETGEIFNFDTVQKLCVALIRLHDIKNIVITLGNDGLILCNLFEFYHIPSEAKSVIDVTGAGDIVIASIAHFLHEGKTLKEACVLANKLASISVSKFGTYVLTKDDINSVIDRKVIFTNGCFDILHRGHIDYLRKSKQLGHTLIIGLNSDASVCRLKGFGRPINTQEDRKAVLESLEFVDQVIIFDEDTPYDLIKHIKPDIITKGGDYKPEDVVGNDLAKVVIIPLIEGYSTTKVMDEIRG